jgi:hypothetical protein
MLHLCETSIGKATYRRETVTFNRDLLTTAKLTHKISYFFISRSREVFVGSLFQGNQMQNNLTHLGLFHREMKAM